MKNILVPGLLGFVFLSLGTVGTILTWEQWRLGSESKNWPSTQGQILKSEIRSTSGTNSSAYPVIHYQYQVDGQLLKSETIRFAAIGGKGPNNANEVVRMFPNGATAEVFYNPEDPSQAVLQPGVFSRTYGLLAAGATSLLFGMFCVFYGTRQYMKMHHMA